MDERSGGCQIRWMDGWEGSMRRERERVVRLSGT